MRQTLRPYQVRAYEETRTLMRDHRAVLIVAPTGSGKTTIAAEIIHGAVERGSRVIFLAHRKELINQCSRRLDQWGVDHGVIQADHFRTDLTKQVQVASLASIKNRLRSGKLKPDARLIIVDEAHRAAAKGYQEVITQHAGCRVLGLTATPVRMDGKGLSRLFDAMVLVAQPRELVADGYLVEPKIYSGETPEDLDDLHTEAGDYVPAELAAAMSKPKLIGDIVEHFLLHIGKGKRSVCFGSSVEHSEQISTALTNAGILAMHVDGTTPAEIRDRILQALQDGPLQVVCNFGILTEGWDLPALDAVILARPTKNVGLYLQMVGRGLRPFPGKEVALVLDHGGNVIRHGWPTHNRDWSLDEGLKKPREPMQALKNCPNCGMVMLSIAQVCEGCGFKFRTRERKKLEHVDGELREISADEAPVPKASELEMARSLAVACAQGIRRRGQLDGHGFPLFAAHQFRQRFGRDPSRAERAAALERARAILGHEASA